jgi:hypothetical protein
MKKLLPAFTTKLLNRLRLRRKHSKVCLTIKSSNFLVTPTLSIGKKETDDYTREEYNRLISIDGMIDINVHKKDVVKEKVKVFALRHSVL